MFILLFEQEEALAIMKHKIKVNKFGDIQLKKFLLEKETIPQEEVNEYEVKLINYRDKIDQLTSEIELIKNEYKNLLENWRKSEEKNKIYQQEIKDLKILHSENVSNLHSNNKDVEEKLKEKVKILEERNNVSTKNFKNELKLSDEILNRYKNHNELLTKQAVIIQNVIKNPKLMADSMRKFNYNEFELYNYKKEKKTMSQRMSQSFNVNMKIINEGKSEISSTKNSGKLFFSFNKQ